jgi:hypothetical protein
MVAATEELIIPILPNPKVVRTTGVRKAPATAEPITIPVPMAIRWVVVYPGTGDTGYGAPGATDYKR